jgi:hypothetical protein
MLNNSLEGRRPVGRTGTSAGAARRGRALGWALAALLLAPSLAAAGSYVEVGDAGELPATAQDTLGLPTVALTSISGSLSSTTDRDLYRIFIPVGSAFSATTVLQPGTLGDTQLFLFDGAGHGVYANDDDGSAQGTSAFRSTLPKGSAFSPSAPGFYYLLITASGAYPATSSSPGALIFQNFTSLPSDPTVATAVLGPIDASRVFAGYTGTTGSSGTYTIALAGAEAAAVPEPGSLAVFSTGILGLLTFCACRRRRRAGLPCVDSGGDRLAEA